jgi:hypothetical protein
VLGQVPDKNYFLEHEDEKHHKGITIASRQIISMKYHTQLSKHQNDAAEGGTKHADEVEDSMHESSSSGKCVRIQIIGNLQSSAEI